MKKKSIHDKLPKINENHDQNHKSKSYKVKSLKSKKDIF